MAPNNIDVLSAIIADLNKRVASLERSQHSPRLSNASLIVEDGRGYIPVIANNKEVARFGRQPDGTYTATSVNNTDPPPQPTPPLVEPTKAGLKVSATGFYGNIPYDFSHLKVFTVALNHVANITKVPGFTIIGTGEDYTTQEVFLKTVNLSGTESQASPTTLGTPLRVVSGDLTDGIITEAKLATAAVTAAKVAVAAITGTAISDGAISTPKLAALAVQAGNIAAAAISTDKLAASAVTAEKIAALAITAGKIAANAVTAGTIAAGSVTAEKLAAIIVMASNVIIAGDPIGARLEISSSGIEQFNALGSPTFQIGANPLGGNFLTIPAADGSILAGISNDGDVSGQDISANGVLYIGGENLGAMIAGKAEGIASWGSTTTNSSSTTTEAGILEISAQVSDQRFYRLNTSHILARGGDIDFHVRITTDGTRPSITSSRFTTSTTPINESTMISAVMIPGTGVTQIKFLLTQRSLSGTTFAAPPLGFAGIQMWLEDLGPKVASTGLVVTGSGGDTAPSQRTTRTWNTTWSRHYHQSTGNVYGIDTVMWQGFSTNSSVGQDLSVFGFDDANIRSVLSGAIIEKVELYLYSPFWYYNTGGTACLGTHNTSTPQANWTNYNPARASHLYHQHFNVGQGQWWVLPNAVGNNFRDNVIKGFVFDAGAHGTDRNYHGYFEGNSQSREPVLRITYTK